MNKEAWINSYLRGMQTNRQIATGEIEKDFIYSKAELQRLSALSARRCGYSHGYWTARLAEAR